MDISSTGMISPAAHLPTAGEPVENIRTLDQATKQFEAIFLRQFLEKAMKPLLHETPGASMAGAGIYQYMMTDVLANSLAGQGQFGFSNMLQMQLAGGEVSPVAPEKAAPAAEPAVPPAGPAKESPSFTVGKGKRS